MQVSEPIIKAIDMVRNLRATMLLPSNCREGRRIWSKLRGPAHRNRAEE